MYKERLHGLADGIFAIVMTLLVIDIRVPELVGVVSDEELWFQLRELLPAFLSYILSFLVLATYWMAHNYIITLFTKNVTRTLAYLNIPFFMAVALIPFSAHLLSTYYFTRVAIAVFASNVIVIGIILALLIRYVFDSDAVENAQFISRGDKLMGYIRALLPVLIASFAIVVSFYSLALAIYVFVVAIALNLFPGVLNALVRVFGATREPHFNRNR
jgi:uncharacterized membrane protein